MEIIKYISVYSVGNIVQSSNASSPSKEKKKEKRKV